MLWGYANGWWPEFLTADEDKLYAKLKFLLEHGFEETGVGLDEIVALSDEERDRLGRFLEDNNLHLTPSIWYDYVNTDDEEAARKTEEIARALRQNVPLLRAWSVFTRSGAGHRFDRTLPVEEKIERLSKRLAPLAAVCHELGTPLGLNNQGDFYISDFIEMCECTPHLFIHLDTANIFWAGERIHPAFDMVAPYVIGTHWRDERIVIGNTKPRGVMLQGCVTGEGDVGLRECYDILVAKAPNPDRLVMELEMFGPREMDRFECLEKSIAFIRSHGKG